jgi:para-aminobenzoate synthetase component 2
MTEGGYRLLANWLELCGQVNAVQRSAGLKPKVASQS